ncbi:FKBP-type peptidyl-prolyl cis-trans isomerase FklB [Pseudomonas cuatrocienegasensis]|uniref:Peptidyl-prolyl cis-trans isomerase n=1 Tax=Pseudomonas cuatrocienegasensis TaxID=543360 RepID=A0ABY1B6J9_9PSED|nr:MULTISPECIES: FKBP-type peptidyl-prolyl cis-trans isomerase [Pseudomonas]OEC36859.1 peptidylprolyl isomerase [Pseudomonas sp. 21C1]SEQ08753.1 FKBP-type peptidyl-prolyl cis-trans isomerase FklB [Pseudomonas cuatrocienegasensis]
MLRALLLLTSLLASLAHAADDAQDLAYSLGARLGERLQREVPDLQLQALLDGLAQAYRGEPLRLDEARIEALLAAHEAQLSNRSDQAQQNEQRFLAEEQARPGTRKLDDGVLVRELQRGKGTRPGPDSRVQVRYRGWLADGSLFDESQEPLWFRLESVIAGWRSAMQQMPVGSRWQLVIPSAQAYGAEGAGDLIAPYAPLVFELELLDTRD